MTPAEKIAEKIAEATRGGKSAAGVFSALAADYSEVCGKLNVRLDQLREVLEGGDAQQALLMAEVYPPVIDEAEALNFPKLDEWRRQCQASKIPVPPEIRSVVIRQLKEIYEQGVSANHAIYKEYRSAILARDDDNAFALAKAIEKLNPADTNARSERDRLENKVFNSRVAALSDALAADDKARILRALSAVERLGLSERESVAPAVQQACEIRRLDEAWAATGKINGFIAQVQTAQQAGDWASVREMVARVEALAAEHQIEPSPEQADIIAAGRIYFSREQEIALDNSRFQDAINSLTAHLEIVERRTKARGTLRIAELQALSAGLVRYWQSVESFSMRVEDEIAHRVSEQTEALHKEIARMQRRRLGMTLAAVFVITAFAAVVGWYSFQHYRANEAAMEIREGIAGRHVGVTKRLVQDAEASLLPKYSAVLAGAIEEARAFQREATETLKMAERHVAEFEMLADGGSFPNSNPIGQFLDAPWSPEWGNIEFSESDPVEVHSTFEALEKEIASLPGEFQTPFKLRMQKSRELLAGWLAKMCEKSRYLVRDRLDVYELATKPTLEKEQSLADFRKAFDPALADAKRWATAIPLPMFELPPELAARLDAVVAKLSSLKSGLDVCESSVAAMGTAKTAEEFKIALAKLADSNLTFLREVAAARAAVPVQTTPNIILGSLLFPGDSAAWWACAKGGDGMSLHPPNLIPAENTAYEKLLIDSNSDNIFEAHIEGSPSRIVYTANEGLSEKTNSVGNRVFSGKIFDPHFDTAGVKFSARSYDSMTYDNRVRATAATDIRRAPFSTIYSAIFSEQFMQDSGDIVAPVWALLDRATGADAKSPAYLAFVAQQIQDMIAVRPQIWGTHFSPAAIAFLKTVKDRLAGERVASGAWMIPAKAQAIEKKLGNIFSKPTAFEKEAVYHQELAKFTKDHGLEFAGYVGADGEPILDSRASGAESLFGLSGTISTNAPARIFESREGGHRALGTPIPLTPLFRFAGDRREALQNAAKASGLSGSSLPVPPPLFSGLGEKPAP